MALKLTVRFYWIDIYLSGCIYNYIGSGLFCKYCSIELRKKKPSKQGLFCNKTCYGNWRSLNCKGEQAPNYIHGKCGENLLIRASKEYQQWRYSVYKRDNFTCVLCGITKGGKLEADHIKDFALYPEYRFDISNGRTLCKECHKQTENYGFKKSNSKKHKI